MASVVAESFFFTASISAVIVAFGEAKAFGLLPCAKTAVVPDGPDKTRALPSNSIQITRVVRRVMAALRKVVRFII
jgi:hypothetical protein